MIECHFWILNANRKKIALKVASVKIVSGFLIQNWFTFSIRLGYKIHFRIGKYMIPPYWHIVGLWIHISHLFLTVRNYRFLDFPFWSQGHFKHKCWHISEYNNRFLMALIILFKDPSILDMTVTIFWFNFRNVLLLLV